MQLICWICSTAAVFYLLPKIHKPGNHGRPIMSLCGAPIEKFCQFVDHRLRPHVETLPSYISQGHNRLPVEAAVHSKHPTLWHPPGYSRCDITVYKKVPHSEGIEACREAQQPSTDNLIELIKQIWQRTTLGSCRISDCLAQTKEGVVYRHVMPRPLDSRYTVRYAMPAPTNTCISNMYIREYGRLDY